MGIENSSAEQISKLELTETNKSDKLKEAMDLAKKDLKIDSSEIDALEKKFNEDLDKLDTFLIQNQKIITDEAKIARKSLMEGLGIPLAEPKAKPASTPTAKPASTEKKEAIKSTNNKFDLTGVVIDEVDGFEGKKMSAVDNLNIREDNKVIGTLKKGEEVILTGNTKNLNGVEFVEIDKKGYVSLRYLKVSGKTDSQQESPAAKEQGKPESKETSKSKYTLKSEEEIKKSITELDLSINPLKEVIIGTYVDSEGKEQKIVLKGSSKNLSVELDGSGLINDLDLKTNPEFASIKKTVDDLLKKYKSEVSSKKGQVDESDKKIVIDTPTDLNNPWPNDPDKFLAWFALTPEQKKWMGGADPTDEFIRARMPKNTSNKK